MPQINEIITAPGEVKAFLIERFNTLLSDKIEEAFLSHLNPLTQAERFELLKDKLKTIVAS